MKTEFLKELGLSEEQIKSIMAENGKDIEAVKTGLADKEAELTTANETIQQLQETVKKFDGVDLEKLKSDVAEWENKYNTDLNKLKFEKALDVALLGSKARNSKAVKALLDMEQIKLDGDKLLGLDTQLEQIQKDNAYLFEADKADTTTVKSGGQHAEGGTETGDSFISAARQAAGLGESK